MKEEIKEIENLTQKQAEEELFREMFNNWDKKTLINHIIGNMDLENIKDWIKENYELENEEEY